MDRAQILRVLKENRERLRALGVGELHLFGSFARGDERPTSDVDLLVDFSGPTGLMKYSRIQRELETLIGRKVDLVERCTLREPLKDRILREAVHAA